MIVLPIGVTMPAAASPGRSIRSMTRKRGANNQSHRHRRGDRRSRYGRAGGHGRASETGTATPEHFYLIENGTGEVEHDGGSLPVRPGSLVLIPASGISSSASGVLFWLVSHQFARRSIRANRFDQLSPGFHPGERHGEDPRFQQYFGIVHRCLPQKRVLID